jgi:hypothetical protein
MTKAWRIRADFGAFAEQFRQAGAGLLRIRLVNGRQLVDLLVEHWEDIPTEFHTSLGPKRGLVLA